MDVPCGNRLLDALSDPGALDIVRTARIVAVRRGDTTTVHGRVMSHVDFPLTVLMSVKGILANGTIGEVASVGSEGFVEVDAALESDFALRSAECQFSGDVARMSLRDFRRALELSRPFALLVRRAVRARIFVTEQTAICNLKHDIVQRLARWLLVSQRPAGAATLRRHPRVPRDHSGRAASRRDHRGRRARAARSDRGAARERGDPRRRAARRGRVRVLRDVRRRDRREPRSAGGEVLGPLTRRPARTAQSQPRSRAMRAASVRLVPPTLPIASLR